MNCFECAKANDLVPAVGLCRHCSVGLCLDHLIEANEYRVRERRSVPAWDSAREAASRRSGRHSGRPPPSLRGCLVNATTDAPVDRWA